MTTIESVTIKLEYKGKVVQTTRTTRKSIAYLPDRIAYHIPSAADDGALRVVRSDLLAFAVDNKESHRIMEKLGLRYLIAGKAKLANKPLGEGYKYAMEFCWGAHSSDDGYYLLAIPIVEKDILKRIEESRKERGANSETPERMQLVSPVTQGVLFNRMENDE